MNKKNDHEKKNEEIEKNGKGQEDCSTVMHPEMARNYEENEPCNDGTKTKRDKPEE